MNLTAARGRKGLSFIIGLAMALTLGIPMAPEANAGHPANSCLDLEPETATNPTGTSHTVTATLRSDGTGNNPCDSSETPVNATQSTTIRFELTGPNDPDAGETTGTLDASCTIPQGQSSCVMTYSGNKSGTDTIRGWVQDSSVDPSEGRDESSQPGPGAEPDDTDVVEKTWLAGTPARLDCDDQSGDDTETNPAGGPEATETYTCKVTDESGNPVGDADPSDNSSQPIAVRGENKTAGVNDPDGPGTANGPSYETPDYGCTPDASTGQCTIQVQRVRDQNGTAQICFWIDSTPGTTTAAEGEVCNAEATNDPENDDSADQVEKTWQPSLPGPNADTRLDCAPETDTNPTRTSHTVTCTVVNPDDTRVVNPTNIDAEATGANDPDAGDTPASPDFTCTTGPDNPNTTNNEAGICSFTHGPGGRGTTNSAGTTTYRAWVDYNNSNGTTEADNTEGQNESSQPGSIPERDGTDVVQKTWQSDPNTLELIPESDTASVGECNPFTVTVKDLDNQPVPGVIIDVEQIHSETLDAQQNDEPTVSFCMPSSGPNRSTVDQSAGDLGPSGENPDRPGTAGGETTTGTDVNGQVTFGISVAAGQGSNGSGEVQVTAFYDKDANNDGVVEDNDDPDQTDPKDTSTKSWAAPAGAGGRSIDCEPETATTSTEDTHTVTCTVRDASGNPQSGVSVSFMEEGPGQLSSGSQQTTDNQGQASVTVSSTQAGQQTITGTITNSFQSEPDTDECDRAANDPQGAQQGVCSDSVTNTWEAPDPVGPQCDDGVDNDGDGTIDHPDDPGCENPNDDDETDPDPEDKCPGYENAPGNHVIGTEGPDVLVGTEDDDIICGFGGDDQIDGLGGNDVILGGSDDDTIDGGDGADEIRGQDGDDTAFGAEGNDAIIGGADDDELSGNGGHDVLLGGGGDDILRGNVGTDFASGGGGNDRVNGGSGRDNLEGGRGNDVITGGLGDDNINGGRGRDRCKGGAGKDTIKNCEGASNATRRRHY